MKKRQDEAARSPLAASIAIHVALAAIILPIALGSTTVARWFRFSSTSAEPVREERIRFVRSAPPRAVAVANGTDKVNGGKAAPPAAPLVAPPQAPTSVPTTAAPAPAPFANGTDKSARGDGSGGPLTGITPSLADPRLYVIPGPGPSSDEIPREAVRARIDSLIRVGVINTAYADSIRRMLGIPNRAPGDWTMSGPGGEKYGIDGNFIRLGKFSIPTALLALLPFNTGRMNVQAYEENRRIAQMSADIRYHAQRAMNEDDFQAAVKRVRERKDRERAELLKRKADELKTDGTVPVIQPQP